MFFLLAQQSWPLFHRASSPTLLTSAAVHTHPLLSARFLLTALARGLAKLVCH